MSFNILNVDESVYVDNSVSSFEYHTYQPYAANSLSHNDEIRIPIQGQDLITLPSQSYVLIEGKLTDDKDKVSTTLKFVNNGVLSLFDEIRYELNGTVIDRNKNPGVSSTLKGYPSYNTNLSSRLINAGWSPTEHPAITDGGGDFSACIPLKMILGFAEDFQKVILNARQELILIRSSSDINATVTSVATEKPKIVLRRVVWKIPHISVSDSEKLKLLKQIERNRDFNIPFRSWELNEFPLLPQTTRHSWTIKASSHLERPRFIIFALQTEKKNVNTRNNSHFDHCNLTNIKLHLNSEIYPYDSLNLNFDNKQWAILYEMYAQFQQSYYYKNQSEPCLSPAKYLENAPLVVIDCSHQNEIVKSGAVDIRLEFESSKNIPDKTSAYCLILHDRLVKYNSLTYVVKVL